MIQIESKSKHLSSSFQVVSSNEQLLIITCDLKMGKRNYHRFVKFLWCVLVIVLITSLVQENSAQISHNSLLSSTNEYTIQVDNKNTDRSSLECVDCYQQNDQRNLSDQQQNLQNYVQFDDLDGQPQTNSPDHSIGDDKSQNLTQPEHQNIDLESQQPQQSHQENHLGRGFSPATLNSTNFVPPARNQDPYNKTIYSSLVKILNHLKLQLDKNKLKEREDQEQAARLSQLELSMNMSPINSHSNPLAQQLTMEEDFSKRLEEFIPSASVADQDSIQPDLNVLSDTRTQNSFSPSSFSSTGSQTSFKPMLTEFINGQSEPQQAGSNYFVPQVPNSQSAEVAEMTSTRASSSSSQTSPPDYQSSGAHVSQRMPDQAYHNYQKQRFKHQPQQPQQPTTRPLDFKPQHQWKLTEKYGLTSPSGSFDDQQLQVTDNKPSQFSLPPTPDSSLNTPNLNYDLPSETTSSYGLHQGSYSDNQHKKSRSKQQHNSEPQLQYPDDPEETYETHAPVTVTSKPTRSRRRRSKSTYKPSGQAFAIRTAPSRKLRATDYLISNSRDHLMPPEQDLTSLISDYPENNQATSVQMPRQDHTAIHLQQVYPLPLSQHQPMQRSQQQQQAVYTLAAAPPGLNLKGFLQQQGQASQISHMSANTPTHEAPTSAASTIGQPQRDLVNQPQTIQITAVPNIQNQPLVRVNGAPLAFNNLANNGLYGGYLDPYGRQVVMLNAERRQVDWSFWFWPILLAVSLPVVLGALFVPVFLKTIVMLIQVLQSLGLLLPLTNALTSQIAKASVVAQANQIEHTKS